MNSPDETSWHSASLALLLAGLPFAGFVAAVTLYAGITVLGCDPYYREMALEGELQPVAQENRERARRLGVCR